MTDSQCIWTVWTEDSSLRVNHHFRDQYSAEQKATQLAKENLGVKFYVMKSVKVYAPRDPIVTGVEING